MLNRDYAEMLSALSDEGAEFLIVGAYAMAAHGVPRATGDLVGREALLGNKQAPARPKDLVDVDILQGVSGTRRPRSRAHRPRPR